MSFSNLMQTTILNILKLLPWCGWHVQVLSNFMKMLTWACYEAFVTVVEERGATATNPKMMPRQHIGSDSSRRYRCTRSGRELVMQGWWGAPGFRVPTVRRHGNRGTCKDLSRTRCKHEHLIQHAHIRSRCRLGVIPSKRAFGAERVRSGSSYSRVVGVVVVHGSCRIHDDDRRTRFVDGRVDGRGTWWYM